MISGKKREPIYFVANLFSMLYIVLSQIGGGVGEGTWLSVIFLFFTAGHITEAASKHQIHLFVRFVMAILLCSRVLNASHGRYIE